MNRLIAAIEKFKPNHFHLNKDHYEKLATGQDPHTLLITCSDSRIEPNLLTGTKAGELFVIRNAGNLIPGSDLLSNEGVTIEFAVKNLELENIVVCGHVDCGAMKKLKELDSLDKSGMIYQGLKAYSDNFPHLTKLSLDDLIKENVLLQMNQLKSYNYIQQALDNGQINLYGMIYDFSKGEVEVVYQEEVNADA